jgi:hypothetical protein
MHDRMSSNGSAASFSLCYSTSMKVSHVQQANEEDREQALSLDTVLSFHSLLLLHLRGLFLYTGTIALKALRLRR